MARAGRPKRPSDLTNPFRLLSGESTRSPIGGPDSSLRATLGSCRNTGWRHERRQPCCFSRKAAAAFGPTAVVPVAGLHGERVLYSARREGDREAGLGSTRRVPTRFWPARKERACATHVFRVTGLRFREVAFHQWHSEDLPEDQRHGEWPGDCPPGSGVVGC